MAEISEKQARRVCEALSVDPDGPRYRSAEDWLDCKQARGWREGVVEVPSWRVVQRAAAEAEEQKP